MNNNSYKTEFFESAVSLGFYGHEASGVFGKKDNVRKYWEDVFIKLLVKPAIQRILSQKNSVRIVDFGCGSGEGFELLTHIPIGMEVDHYEKSFLLKSPQIESYVGLDISPSMVAQGKKNYEKFPNIKFIQHDLTNGFPLSSEPPFDIYFSSYSSLSHLTRDQLAILIEQVLNHIGDSGFMFFDMFGRLSPEWPDYWNKSNNEMLDYNMAYLFRPEQQASASIESYKACFWTGNELSEIIESVARKVGKKVKLQVKDRSILIGRHMDTGLFNLNRNQLRYQVNRLWDRDRRGQVGGLKMDLSFLSDYRQIHPRAWQRINDYKNDWNQVVAVLEALMRNDNDFVAVLITSAQPHIAEELKMLAWLFRNANRFPVVDFWASIMGPQVACILRNLEYSLPDGLGCGHGLLCVAEVSEA